MSSLPSGFHRTVPPGSPSRAPWRAPALAASLVTLALTACDSSASGTDLEPGQIYELDSVSGEPLPFDQGQFTVLTGSLILGTDGSCRRTVRVRIESPDASDVITVLWTCSWTETEGALEVTWHLIGVPDLTSDGTRAEGAVVLDVPIALVCVVGPCEGPWTEAYVEASS